MIDIIIPTNKEYHKITRMITRMKNTISSEFRICPTCFKTSAPVNRNYGLIQAKSDIVIMVDDDIKGYYPGWADELVKPLEDPAIIMVSARLMDNKTKPGVMMDIKPDFSKPVVDVPDFYSINDTVENTQRVVKAVPSAAIAFRNDGTRFDENYIGAGFEDTHFCFELCCKYPSGRIVINNNCKLIHKNEMKNQLNGQLSVNQAYFRQFWGLK